MPYYRVVDHSKHPDETSCRYPPVFSKAKTEPGFIALFYLCFPKADKSKRARTFRANIAKGRVNIWHIADNKLVASFVETEYPSLPY